MSDLTEREIFDCLETNALAAAQDCVNIARLPQKGPHYQNFLNRMKLLDGAARQASTWREDTRWLNFYPVFLAAEQNAGRWLRGGYASVLFLDLAKVFVDMHKCIIHLKTAKTGRRGMILPDVLEGPHRDTRPSRVVLPENMPHIRPSGIIVPGALA